jgi:hypothetical protein
MRTRTRAAALAAGFPAFGLAVAVLAARPARPALAAGLPADVKAGKTLPAGPAAGREGFRIQTTDWLRSNHFQGLEHALRPTPVTFVQTAGVRWFAVVSERPHPTLAFHSEPVPGGLQAYALAAHVAELMKRGGAPLELGIHPPLGKTTFHFGLGEGMPHRLHALVGGDRPATPSGPALDWHAAAVRIQRLAPTVEWTKDLTGYRASFHAASEVSRDVGDGVVRHAAAAPLADRNPGPAFSVSPAAALKLLSLGLSHSGGVTRDLSGPIPAGAHFSRGVIRFETTDRDGNETGPHPRSLKK